MLRHLEPALRAARYYLKTNIPNMSSSHVSECLAASFGYNSHAALSSAMDGPTAMDDIPDDPDVAAFCRRAKVLGRWVLPDLVEMVLRKSLKDVRPHIVATNEFLGVINDAIVDGCARRNVCSSLYVWRNTINANPRGKGFVPQTRDDIGGFLSSGTPPRSYVSIEFDKKVNKDIFAFAPYIDVDTDTFFDAMLKLAIDDGESILVEGKELRITPDHVKLPQDIAFLRGTYSYGFERSERGWKHTAAFKAVYFNRPADGSKG